MCEAQGEDRENEAYNISLCEHYLPSHCKQPSKTTIAIIITQTI